MRIDVLTIFPEYLAPLGLSLAGKAQKAGLLEVRTHDLRAWAQDRHHSVDDTPIGGGAGMVMRPDVWGRALDDVLGIDAPGPAADQAPAVAPTAPPAHLVIPTPSGDVFDERAAERLARAEHLVFACGRYEGIDARVAERYRDAGVDVSELSIGDYVLSGGEAAVLVMCEAIARLVPGFVGNPASLVEESHGAAGLLEYPVYTRPASWEGRDVPEVLLSGHHAHIARWRRDQALRRTADRRPDMIGRLDAEHLGARDLEVLGEFGWTVLDGRLRRGAASDVAE